MTRADQTHAVLETAYKRSVNQPVTAKLAFLHQALGLRLTAAALGVKDSRTVQSWEDGGSVRGGHDQEHRIQALYRATFAVSEIYSPAVAAAFLRGSNPHLDGRAPFLVLADDPPTEAEERVLRAVEALLEA